MTYYFPNGLAIYNRVAGRLTEVPPPKPTAAEFMGFDPNDRRVVDPSYWIALEEWRKACASLKSCEVSPEILPLLKEGEVYKEGEDFKVQMHMCAMDSEYECWWKHCPVKDEDGVKCPLPWGRPVRDIEDAHIENADNPRLPIASPVLNREEVEKPADTEEGFYNLANRFALSAWEKAKDQTMTMSLFIALIENAFVRGAKQAVEVVNNKINSIPSAQGSVATGDASSTTADHQKFFNCLYEAEEKVADLELNREDARSLIWKVLQSQYIIIKKNKSYGPIQKT